ncbi:MAG: excinuclease ABC subunit UvrA, partial [Candidatus Lambdaproteobacteria bacterium]|nr:excinuclease ABC subunit UvrA [Candidatus Lambdaproteobacteria bacterium]
MRGPWRPAAGVACQVLSPLRGAWYDAGETARAPRKDGSADACPTYQPIFFSSRVKMTSGHESDRIVVVGASEHNLRNLSLELPRNTLTVFTGVSGSGKSSLAFDTLFKEGQRRFLESLSPYARQFLGQMEKPRVEHVEGLSPTISIDQKTVNRNPRSTVGTITELYDHFRLLYARFGQPYCPTCAIPIATLTPEQIADTLFARFGQTEGGTACTVLAPMIRERKGEYRRELAGWLEQGYLRARIDGELRRLDEDIALARYEKHSIELALDRFRIEPKTRSRLAEAVEQAMTLSGGLVQVEVAGELHAYSGNMACPRCGLSIPELEPRLFSFNDPQGACETCNGLGTLRQFAEERLADAALSLDEGALRCFTERGNLPFTDITRDDLSVVARGLGIDTRKPWGRLPVRSRDLLLDGNADIRMRVRNVFRQPHLLVDGARHEGQWPGLRAVLEFVGRFVGAALERFQEETLCPTCNGLRLNPVARAVRFRGQTIDQLAGATVEDAVAFFEGLALNATETLVGKDIFREIRGRLGFLRDVGVGYLSLDRRATTLSGGEAQRIRLASQVGSGLQGVLYVLDEPSIGLHQSDNRKLLETLRSLRDVGNTVYVVEHDQETIEAADHLVDLGPGAGDEGGRVLAQGTLADLVAAPESLSGRYLSGSLEIPLPARRRPAGQAVLTLHGVRKHNLDGLDVSVPLGLFVAVTGVSGSGKSTLVHDVLKPALGAHLHKEPAPRGLYRRVTGLRHLDKVIEIDQSPIGRTPRSNPATYTKVLDAIRGLFAQTPEARIRGYKPGRFSFNVKGGRCEACEGAGVQTIEMQFLSNVEMVCEECGGRRFNDETLQIHYKGRTIHDVLEMTVDEAAGFFAQVPPVAHILSTLREVGLGYIRLGQPSTTLSGGEAQRVKLASELRKRGTGQTLYLLDEPTTGLHFHDIRSLLECLNRLVEAGNTVLVIEHNLDVIKVADHVIDLGPGGGRHGGRLVCAGTPEQVAAHGDSLTGRELAHMLRPRTLTVRPAPPLLARNGKRDLVVRGAEKNNLQHVDVRIPRNSFTVITGVSGSGKTSLAFDTIFAEGQARYVESLSTYARRFLGRMDKARVDGIDGLAPAIAIDQKNSGRSPRSTVATITEIYDYLRLLYARIGHPHCPTCGTALDGFTPTRLARLLAQAREGERLVLAAPLYRPGSTRAAMLDDPAHLTQLAEALLAEGFTRIMLGAETVELADWLARPKERQRVPAGTAVDLVIDRLRVQGRQRKRLAEAIELAFAKGHGLARLRFPDDAARTVHHGVAPQAHGGNGAALPDDAATATERFAGPEVLVSAPVGCVDCDYYLDEPFVPRMFSFNSHVGACEACAGLGKSLQVDPALLVPFPERPLLEGALVAGKLGRAVARKNWKAERTIRAFARREGIDLERPFGQLSRREQGLLLHGDGQALSVRRRWGGLRSVEFRGIAGIVLEWYRDPQLAGFAQHIEPVMADVACPACDGERLKPAYRAVAIDGLNIAQFCAYTVEEALAATARWKLTANEALVAQQPRQEIRARLGFLKDVGLGYLNLRREATTLSGGEAQRIRLASQLGSHLVGVLYVLDEPTIGLHPRDTRRLVDTLLQLRDRGNTVLVVEHDPETIRAADHVIDIGPGAGHLGGRVVAAGTPQELAAHPDSLTGAYLAGRASVPLPDRPRPWRKSRCLTVQGARANNLRNIDVAFPLGTFTVVTGVSGSGKSTLVVGILQNVLQRTLDNARVVPGAHRAVKGLNHVDKVVVIDQSPIGRTPKSNPATYTGAMDGIRALMARVPEAQVRGYKAGRFSFNVKGGRCEACEGRGMNHIEMHFLADV